MTAWSEAAFPMKLTADLQPYSEPGCLLAAIPAGLNVSIFRYLVSAPEIP